MVRLKADYDILTKTGLKISIPYGAIKRKAFRVALMSTGIFQFLMVRLKVVFIIFIFLF